LYLLYVIYGRLIGSITDPGYASLMSVVLFACGIQLLILGVVGEYVGRLMGATFRRPVYVVDCDTGSLRTKPMNSVVTDTLSKTVR
jgi:hypothetical protein